MVTALTCFNPASEFGGVSELKKPLNNLENGWTIWWITKATQELQNWGRFIMISSLPLSFEALQQLSGVGNRSPVWAVSILPLVSRRYNLMSQVRELQRVLFQSCLWVSGRYNHSHTRFQPCFNPVLEFRDVTTCAEVSWQRWLRVSILPLSFGALQPNHRQNTRRFQSCLWVSRHYNCLWLEVSIYLIFKLAPGNWRQSPDFHHNRPSTPIILVLSS